MVSGTDRRALARWAIEAELFGPVASLGRDELALRCEGLPLSEAQELSEYLTRPLTDRHRRFRAMAGRLSTTYGDARRALAKMDHRPTGLRDERDLERWSRVDGAHRRSLRDSAGGGSGATMRRFPAAIADLVFAVNRAVRREFPALDELSWSRDWLLRVARQQDEYAKRGGDPDEWSLAEHGLKMSELTSSRHDPELHLRDTAQIGFGEVIVGWSPSKEEARERLRVAVKATIEAREDRNTLPAKTDYAGIHDLIEELLAVEYPAGNRPYSLDSQTQTHRDVSLWARVKLDGETPAGIAIDSRQTFGDGRAKSGRRWFATSRGAGCTHPTSI